MGDAGRRTEAEKSKALESAWGGEKYIWRGSTGPSENTASELLSINLEGTGSGESLTGHDGWRPTMIYCSVYTALSEV